MLRYVFLLIVVTVCGELPLATAAEVDAESIEKAGSLICAWKPMTGKAVVDRCKELGFEIKGGSQPGNWVVCEWNGRLDAAKVAALASDERVRYVEANVRRYKLEDVPTEAAVTDDLLKEIQKVGSFICAWRPGEEKAAFQYVKDELKLDVIGGDGRSTMTCRFNDEVTQEKLAMLLENPAIRYVEPNFKRTAGPPVFGGGGNLVGEPVTRKNREAQQPNDPRRMLVLMEDIALTPD